MGQVERLVRLLFFVIVSQHLDCSMDYCNDINLIWFNGIYDSIWTDKNFSDLIYVIFRDPTARQRKYPYLL